MKISFGASYKAFRTHKILGLLLTKTPYFTEFDTFGNHNAHIYNVRKNNNILRKNKFFLKENIQSFEILFRNILFLFIYLFISHHKIFTIKKLFHIHVLKLSLHYLILDEA